MRISNKLTYLNIGLIQTSREKEREREQKALTITISSKTTVLYQVLLVIILWNLKVNCRIFKTHHFTGLDIKKIFKMLIQIKPVVVL